MFLLRTVLISVEKTTIDTDGWDNLAYTAKALHADYLTYRNLNYESLAKYQMVILVDNKDYRICDGVAKKIRQMYPNIFMGWHQESCCTNIFRRHKIHGNYNASEESWQPNLLSIWETIQACDFIICHNTNDFSLSFYDVFSGHKPCFALSPFLPIEEATKYWKSREQKEKIISIGYNYDWREGGFLGYMIAKEFPDFKLIQQRRGNPNSEAAKVAEKMINENFYKIPVETVPARTRIEMINFFSCHYIAINLREPTACRTNAACGASGTPMIGNRQSDVQCKLFPELSIDKYNLVKAVVLIERLIRDKIFYDDVSRYAQENLWQIGIEQSTKELTENISKIYEAKK